MNRQALEHLLRAASAITNERELVVIGSQAILGQFPDAPDSLLASIEADPAVLKARLEALALPSDHLMLLRDRLSRLLARRS